MVNIWVPVITFGVVFLTVLLLLWVGGRTKVLISWIWSQRSRKKEKKPIYNSSDDENEDSYSEDE